MIKKIMPGLTVAFVLLLIASLAFAVEGIQSGSILSKSLIKGHCKYIDVNQIRSSVMNDGTFTRHPITGNADMVWPKGTGKYICYAAGIWIAGLVDGVIRTACSDYNVEFQPGIILADGSPDDPAKDEYRVYKVHKDYADGTPAGDVLDIDSWSTWQSFAEQQGAPPVSDGSGNWIGYGDEMLYAVMNDLDQNMHSICYCTQPIGIEFHLLVFAFDRAGALGNAMFIKYTLINKGEGDVMDCYIGSWSDVDNGDSNDDLIGYDIKTGMSYCYGGKPSDATYGNRPPALGWDFFQGPIVDSPGDTARLPDGTLIPDKKILGATSFNKYYNSHPVYRDPPYSAQGAEWVYNYLAGLQKDGAPWTNPLTGEETTFLNTGDPVTQSGWLSTMEAPPSDIRMLTGSGPFTLAAGDTQEIVVGCVIAQGGDRLSSVALLRVYDEQLQMAYNLGFNVPSPPLAPEITVSELDRKILLTWEKDAEDYQSDAGYTFEGYNIYIGDSPGGPWKRLETYDIENGIMSVLDVGFDENTGAVLNLPSAFGKDVGLKYNYTITKDYDDLTLANGRYYYIVVTSYGYNGDAVPKILESAKKVMIVTPHQGRPGTVVSHDSFEEVAIEHTAGTADEVKYEVWVKMIDPLHVETAAYEVTINADSTWTLWKNGQALPDYTDLSEYAINKSVEFKTLVGAEMDFFFGINVDFEVEVVTAFKAELATEGSDQSLIEKLTNPAEAGKPTALAVDGQFRKGTRDESIIYNDLEIRFTGAMDSSTMKVTSGGQLATLMFSFGDAAFFMAQHPENPNPGSRDPFLVRIPFEVWDIDRNIQLNLSFTDNAQKISDSLFVPTWAPRGECVCYVIATEYDEQVHNCSFTGQDTMATWTFIFKSGAIWQTGDIVKLVVSAPEDLPKPVVAGVDKFAFTIQGETDGVIDDAKKRLDIINVFPNPYFAYNLEETQLHHEHVTFINLPAECTIRIFTIAGQLVRTIDHEEATATTHRWDLRNENNLPVASGLYIAHIDVPDVGEKIVKMAVVFRKQRLKNL